jgi:hypothetical protein
MQNQADKSIENNRSSSLSSPSSVSKSARSLPVNISGSIVQKHGFLADNRQQSVIQKKLIEAIESKSESTPIQQKSNKTGLPDNLKSGIENLSGHSMDDVKVHYNSDKPAQLNAHAHAQGTNIHIASGQEKHLPHEAWHVVQQKQGRVKPTMQMKGKVNVNDDKGLENEADVMGAKALQLKGFNGGNVVKNLQSNNINHSTNQNQKNTVQRITINNTNFVWLDALVLNTDDPDKFKQDVLGFYQANGSLKKIQKIEQHLGSVATGDDANELSCYQFLTRFVQTKINVQATDDARPADSAVIKKFTHAVVNAREIMIPKAIAKLRPWINLSGTDRSVVEYCFSTNEMGYDLKREAIIKVLNKIKIGLTGAFPISDVSNEVRRIEPNANGFVNPIIDKLNIFVQFTGGRRIHLKFNNSLAETTFTLIHEASHLHANTIDGTNAAGGEAAYIRAKYPRYMDWEASIARGENPAAAKIVRRLVDDPNDPAAAKILKLTMEKGDPTSPEVKAQHTGPREKGMTSDAFNNADSYSLLVYGLNGITPP